MPVNRIIVLIAAGLVVLDVIWLFIRGKKNGFTGKEEFSRVMLIRIISGFLMSVCLLVVLWFREFGMIGDIVLCGCAVLSVEVESKLLLGSSQYDEDMKE